MTRTVIVFARAPRLGRVKRRLAVGIGDIAALRFYRMTTERVVRRLAHDRRWRTVLAVTGGAARWPRGIPRIVQRGDDLGQRMGNAMRAAPQGPVVLVGSDIPDLRPRHVARAFHALAGHDAVFGPAADGGYWLVGVRDRALLRRLFGEVRWSTAHTLEDTIANLPGGRRYALVDALDDVDDAASWWRWLGRRRGC